MLNVQRYLQTNTLDQLAEERGILATHHDSLPLVILNYHQIESPKTDPIVRECRGLVLHSDTFEVVARSFPRFFNWGEVAEEMPLFDFSDFTAQSKEDGSLVLLYHFDGKWRVNTRGTFAQDNMMHQPFSWESAVAGPLGGLGGIERIGAPGRTYVCEFCSPWNKVVRRYEEPEVYLLSIIDRKTGEEASAETCDDLANRLHMKRPATFDFADIEGIQAFLDQQAEDDPTFEGIVMRDCDGRRWKIKSATYLGLHKLRGEDGDTWNPKYMLPFVLAGEEDELLTYFPECKAVYFELKARVLQWYANTLELWAEHWRLEDQKAFALQVKDAPFAGVLFSVRKRCGEMQSVEELRREWRRAERYILKHLNGKGPKPR